MKIAELNALRKQRDTLTDEAKSLFSKVDLISDKLKKFWRNKTRFLKVVTRQYTIERGSSLCGYCGKEQGTEDEHIWPTSFAEHYLQETAEYFTDIMGYEVTADLEEIAVIMKSGNNYVKCCTRCNFDKRRDEDNATSPEARKAVCFQWLNKGKKWNGKTWISRTLKVATGQKRSKDAQTIAHYKGKNVFARAKVRRKVRGKKEW